MRVWCQSRYLLRSGQARRRTSGRARCILGDRGRVVAPVIALRTGTDGRTVLPLFIGNAVSGRPLNLVAGGVRTQDFLHVDDAARGIVDVAASEATGTYNLASERRSMLELALAITALPGCNVEIMAIGGVERSPSVRVDISKAQREWGYAPSITIAGGIGTYHASLLAGVP